MPQKRKWKDNAERQREYRARKKKARLAAPPAPKAEPTVIDRFFSRDR